MYNILIKVKSYFISFFSIIVFIIPFIFLILLIYYLRKNNKRLQIIPEIKIVDMQQDIHIDILTEAITKSKEILKKIQQ